MSTCTVVQHTNVSEVVPYVVFHLVFVRCCKHETSTECSHFKRNQQKSDIKQSTLTHSFHISPSAILHTADEHIEILPAVHNSCFRNGWRTIHDLEIINIELRQLRNLSTCSQPRPRIPLETAKSVSMRPSIEVSQISGEANRPTHSHPRLSLV